MSRHDYEQSKVISMQDYTFAALIMAAMRQADTDNQIKLAFAWPEIWRELDMRYNSPGGFTEEEMPPYPPGRNKS